MKKLFIITALFLLTLSGCTEKTETTKEEEPIITEKDIIKNAFDELPVSGYYYNSLKNITNISLDYLTDEAADLLSATIYEYERRNNTVMDDIKPEKLVELDRQYFGIDEEISAYLYESLDDFTVTEEVVPHNNNKVLIYKKEGDIFNALISPGDFCPLICYEFVFDGDFINIMDYQIYEPSLLIEKENDNEAVYLLSDGTVLKIKDNEITNNICLPEQGVPMYLISENKEGISISENLNYLELKRNGGEVLVDFTDSSVSLNFDNLALEREEVNATNKDGDRIVEASASYAHMDIWLFKKDGSKKFIDSGQFMNGGFFMNGDIYTMTYNSFHIFHDEKLAYVMEDHFNLKDNVLFAVRKVDDSHFYIVYSLYSNSSDAFISDTDYEVALIDYEGNIIKHVDTGIPVHLSKHFYYSVTMRYDEKLDRLFIDLGAGSITFEVDGDSFRLENVVNNID
ncbi:MAG: hypothetical protein ACI4WM_05565 [Erysipelotrichaceae bacterium]